MPQLATAVLVDGPSVDHAVFQLIEVLGADEARFLPPMVLTCGEQPPPTGGLSGLLLGTIKRIETWMVRRTPRHRAFENAVDLRDMPVALLDLTVDGADAPPFDVVVDCRQGERRPLPVPTRLGALRLCHGAGYGLEPAGFWEVYRNEADTGFRIERTLGDRTPEIVFGGHLLTASYWTFNRANVTAKGFHFLLKLLERLADGEEIGSLSVAPESVVAPTIGTLTPLRYFASVVGSTVRQTVLKKLGYDHRWAVSHLPNAGPHLELSRATTIPNPPKRFLADPFVWTEADRTVCFLEEYFYSESKGKISAYEFVGGEAHPLGVVLDEEFHLSFPFVFEHAGRIFMCPETSQKNEIRLYVCERFPDRWSFHKTLMRNVSAADTVLFPHAGSWFLLTNFCSLGSTDHNSELHLFSAEAPDSDAWRPCPANPVILDSRKARTGGFFAADGALFRINQIPGKGHYGRAFALNKIVDIGPDHYVEQKVAHIEPDFLPGLSGTHHLHANENFRVFDHSTFERI